MHEDKASPGRLPAAILAVLVHLLFIAFLIFSVNWKSHPPAPVMADLWEALPPPRTQPVVKPQPAPKPKPEPVIEPQPARPRPDIALKEKKHKEREQKQRIEREQQAQLAQQKQAEAEQRKQQLLQQKKLEAEQRKLAEQEKQQQEAKRKQDEVKRKQEALRKLNEQQARDLMNKELANETSRLRQAEQASRLGAEQAKMEATYKERIRSKIASMLNLPENMVGNPKAVFAVTVLPSGEVAQVKLISSSGQPAYDTAVERAILKAVPLPLPPDKTVAARFRDLTLPIQPKQEN